MTAPPPQQYEAERSVIGALLLSPDAIWRVRLRLRPDHFFFERHGAVYRAACTLADSGQPIDLLTMRTELERTGWLAKAGGVDALSECTTECPAASSVMHYAELVIESATRRALLDASSQVGVWALDPNSDVDELGDRCRALIDRAVSSDAAAVPAPLGAGWGDFFRDMAAGPALNGVLTGIPSLDVMLQGLQPGELYVLAARPSVGKTALALNIALRAARDGVPACFYSLEMTELSLRYRLAASASGVDSFILRSHLASPAQLSDVDRAMRAIRTWPITVDDRTPISIPQLRGRSRILQARGRLGLIVVDYLQLVETGEKQHHNRVAAVGAVARGLKEIAKELRVPVLALSQLSRQSERRDGKRPQLDDLRDSGEIEQHADSVWFLHRQGDRSERQVATLLIVDKNRNGPIGDIGLGFSPALSRFEERDIPEQTVSLPASGMDPCAPDPRWGGSDRALPFEARADG